MSLSTMTAFAAGAGACVALYMLKRQMAKPSEIKVTYFDIAAVPGEKLRLALSLTVGKGGFEDERIKFASWAAEKEKRKPKYGQMPIVTVDGQEFFQSGAMLRYFGSVLGDGSLYPTSDTKTTMKIEEMIGLCDDFEKAWTPCVYVSMRPAFLGYPADWPEDEKKAKTQAMRETFVANDMPKFLGFISRELEATGAFLAGPNVTIADCQLLPRLLYFERGAADYVPKDILNAYPAITAYIARLKALPAIKEWYGM